MEHGDGSRIGHRNGVAAQIRGFFSQDTPERGILGIAGLNILLLAAGMFFLYWGFFRGIAGFESRFAPFLFFFLVFLVMNTSFIRYFKGIRREVSCMTGCMSGMTVGMVSGFTLGMVVGATNGMLVGSVYGLLIGMLFGSWVGRCCGLMGTMEGMMAGLMGGVMGAMTSLMLISENVFIFLGVLGAASALILAFLTKHMREEGRESGGHYKPMDILSFFSLNLFILLLTTWLVIYGPKSVIVAQITWGV
jgi:hypothetical protein